MTSTSSAHTRAARLCAQIGATLPASVLTATPAAQPAPVEKLSMPRRELGQTGLHLSVVSFGASPLGGVFGPIDESEGIAAVASAFESGINFFDTSPFYGQLKSEAVLGRALSALFASGRAKRPQVIVATKVGRYGDREFDFSAARVERSIDESLRRLQLSYVDLLIAHDVEFGDLDQIIRETLPAMRKLKRQGKARFIGISGLPLHIFEYVIGRLAAEDANKRADEKEEQQLDFILTYAHNTLSDTSAERLLAIPQIRSGRVGVINASPFGLGLLTHRAIATSELPSWHPAPAALREAAAEAAKLCQERGADIANLAVRFSIENKQLASTLIGMSTRECSCCQSEESAATAVAVASSSESRSLGLSRQLLRDVRAVFAQRGVADLSWPSGRPENNADVLARLNKAEHDPEVAAKLARFDRWADEHRNRIASGESDV